MDTGRGMGKGLFSTAGSDAGCLLLRLAAFAAGVGMVLLFLMIAAFALPLFADSAAGGPFTWTWAPAQGRFGIMPMIAGSLLAGTSAIVMGWPLGFCLCCWMLCPEGEGRNGRGHARRAVGALVRLMTAVPTVVYGFAAVFLLVPLLRQGFGGTGFSCFAAAVMLSLLVLPTIVLVLQAGLGPRLEAVELQCAALGMSRLEALWHVVLPQCRRVLLASVILGFGRAVGDTMLPLMLAGSAPVLPAGMLASMRTLTAHMALVTSNEVGGAAYGSLFMAGFLLLALNAAVSLTLRRMGGRQ